MATLDDIRARRLAIQEEIKTLQRDLQRRISALTSEDQELEIAERVLERFTRPRSHAEDGGNQARLMLGPLTLEAEGRVSKPPTPKVSGTISKPEDIPTMPEMIREALRFAKLRGKPGLEPKEMAEFSASKWWQEVDPVSVSPIAWRMMKRGDLIKPLDDKPVYTLPDDEAPSEGQSEGASEVTGEGDASPIESRENLG